jgi:hypothetical protein
MISFNRSILTCILASILSNATHAFDISFQTKGSRTTEKNEFELQINHHGDIRDSIFRTSNTVSFDLPTEESIVKFLMRKTSAPNHWEGFSGSTTDNAYFLLSPDGRSITGSFQGPTGTYYMIRTQPDDKIIVEVIPHDEMKEEDEGLFPPSDLSADKEDANNIVSRADSGDSVDLMVVYTMNAMCLQAGLSSPCTNNAANRLPIENLIQLAVNNNNAAHTNSATGVQMNLVHTYLAADYTEPGDTLTALYDLTYTSSQGYPALDEVHSLRDTYGADMVMLMGSIGTGVAWVESSSSSAFSYMNRSNVSYHTMAHELGHNWGCYHNRDNSSTQVDYAHGYQDPGGAFRSILSYNCPGGCTRVNWYSSPDVTYNGATIGTSTEDCARKIQERRVTVANFRQHVEGPTPTPPSPTPPSPTPPSPTPPSPTEAPTSGDDSISFKNKAGNNLCMGVKGFYGGAPVITKACSSTENQQKFQIDDKGRIHMYTRPEFCLKKAKALMKVAKCGGTNIFKFAYSSFDSRLVYYPAPLPNVLAIANDTPGFGKAIKLVSFNNNAQTQFWEIK